ncbi:sulfatase-like hydrolase/transferase [Aristaeella hokkaidonensis]|uniref:Sulfatase-like hydrolase/transferase n=1 Tax=Aristaeella hokkaidonensis TaxID=3046382 RepID=A0AC61MVQ7_9FIRM|nr:sulfatase-like hydrolase/transferase [Aristaeella hokkaidonensis]QUC66684.1 sulfatase-like hydrolase/transferase [Aristaeella hokkaidonensis]
MVFTLFGYGPAELYFSNQGSEEFWFAFSEILWPVVFIGLGVFIVVLGLLMVLPTKGYHYALATIMAVSVLMLVQTLFLPNNYGSLNGTQIDWNQYTGRLIYNTVIWLAVIAGAIFWAIRNWIGFRSWMRIAAVILLFIQAVILVITGVTNSGRKAEKEIENVYLTTNNLYTVSDNENTIVFVLDAFDSQIMCDLLEEYPEELTSIFKDFTFYHNTNGGATRTKYAIPYILTGKTNDTGGTYAEYLKESFQESPLFKELRTGKYNTGFFTEYGYVDRTQTDAIENLSSGGMHTTSEWGLSQSVLKMTAFKYMPHILKPFFWMYSFELAQWRGGSSEATAYKIDDIQFYQQLREKKLAFVSGKPAFRFIHLRGAHGPFTMDENMNSIPHEQGTEKQQALGSLRIVSEYIEQLKDQGVYDNTNIIILADHGDKGYVKPNYEQNPLLMIKMMHENKDFSVSDLSLSYLNISGMIAELLRNGFIRIEDYEVEGARYFYVGAESNNSYHLIEYASHGKAYDASSYYATGHDYEYQNNDITYNLGTILYFGEAGGSTAKRYFVKGFSYPESSYVWTSDNEVKLQFDLGLVEKDLALSFDYVAVSKKPQRVYIYAGDQLIASYIAQKAEKKDFIIPKESVKEGILNITFKLPDALSSLKAGTGIDGRITCLALKSILIDVSDYPFEEDKQLCIKNYSLGEEITFGSDGNMGEYAISGISNDHWTNSKNVTMKLYDVHADSDLEFVFSYRYINSGEQHVTVFANKEQIADYVATEPEEKILIIPKSIISNDVISIEINFPDATPGSKDKRERALWIKRVVIREAELLQ